MSFPGHSFRSFMIICIQLQMTAGGRARAQMREGRVTCAYSYCVHFLSLYIGYLFVFIFLFMYMYILI